LGPLQSPRTTHYSFSLGQLPPPKVSVVGSVPLDQSAVLEPIGSQMNKSLSTGDQYVIVSEGEPIIDGLDMKNVIFQGVKIIYHGGPLRMNNVFFVNCTFELPQDQRGQNLAFALLQSPTTTFSAS
jgi:hypothetical protein